MMKTIPILTGTLFLCAALAGCRKSSDWAGRDIAFRAGTTQPRTKTAYSGEMDGAFERIDWTDGDVIRILSDKARTTDSGSAWADYRVGTPTASGRRSVATLSNDGLNGLAWADGDDGTYQFWAVYPSPASGAAVTLSENKVTGVIPSTQDWTGAPDMDIATMTAAASSTPGSGVSLDFYPAFTAFEFSLASADEDIVLERFELYSTSSAVAGGFEVVPPTGRSSVATAFEAGVNDRIQADLGAFTVTPSRSLTFTVFALPQDMTDLTILFYTDKGTRRLALKRNGAPILFEACKKYRITGLAMPGQLWKMALDLGLEVVEWDDVPLETDFKDNIIATPFLFDEDTMVLDGKTARYTGSTMVLSFSVSAPKGGVWRIQKAGNDPDAFVVTVYDETDGSESEDLHGGIRPDTRIVLHVRPIDALTGYREQTYTMLLKTTAELGLRSFSMDSETQGIDAEDGDYYTFLLPANE